MALIDGLLQELELEAQTTRRVLERVPDDKLTWRPHAKARTLGELALHIAPVPGNVAQIAAQSQIETPRFSDPSPARASELVPALGDSIARAKSLLGGMDDATLMSRGRMMQGDRAKTRSMRGGLGARSADVRVRQQNQRQPRAGYCGVVFRRESFHTSPQALQRQ